MDLMNKADLINSFSEKMDTTKVYAQECVETLIDIIQQSLIDQAKSGEKAKFTLSNFGTFGVSKRKAFDGLNPRTGEKMTVQDRLIPTFRAGKEFKKALNS
jgi:DNA-binding protein HU-beta